MGVKVFFEGWRGVSKTKAAVSTNGSLSYASFSLQLSSILQYDDIHTSGYSVTWSFNNFSLSGKFSTGVYSNIINTDGNRKHSLDEPTTQYRNFSFFNMLSLHKSTSSKFHPQACRWSTMRWNCCSLSGSQGINSTLSYLPRVASMVNFAGEIVLLFVVRVNWRERSWSGCRVGDYSRRAMGRVNPLVSLVYVQVQHWHTWTLNEIEVKKYNNQCCRWWLK